MDRPPWQPLWPLPPIVGESLLGWATRTAHHNVLPSCYTLLRAAGNHYQDLPTGALVRVDAAPDLARILGADLKEVTTRMLMPAPHRSFIVLGDVAVRRVALTLSKRRFSPRSVAGAPFHRQAWMLKNLPFCAESWEYLQEHCVRCRALQRWLHASDIRHCDQCGGDLAAQPVETVAPEHRDHLSKLHALMAGGAASAATRHLLSPALNQMEAGALFDLVCTLAGLIDPELPRLLSARVDMVQHRRLTAALAQAWGLMEDYPESVFDGLWDIGRDENGQRQRKFIRRLSETLGGTDRHGVLPETRTALESLRRLVAGTKADRRNVLVKPAARLLRITETEVARARDSGEMTLRLGMSNGRVLYGIDKDEVEHLAEVRRNTLSPFAVGKRLFMPAYAVQQLVDLHLLEAEQHPWIVRFYGGAPITNMHLAAFLDRLRSAAVAPCDVRRPASLARLMRGYGGGPKPWGEVLRRLISGEMQHSACDWDGDMRDVMVSADEANSLWTIPPVDVEPTYIQLDALDILNHALKKSADLKPFRLDESTNGRWLVDGSHVARVAADRMSSAELAVRTGLEVYDAMKAVLHRGADRPTSFGWSRMQLFKLADDLLWSAKPTPSTRRMQVDG